MPRGASARRRWSPPRAATPGTGGSAAQAPPGQRRLSWVNNPWISARLSAKKTMCWSRRKPDEQAGIRRGYGDMDSLGAISRVLSQVAFIGTPPVSLVPSVSLLVGFPESCPKVLVSER